ncbi:hypothetical protein GCM10010399_72470 [Dactylosporangium fulvum]
MTTVTRSPRPDAELPQAAGDPGGALVLPAGGMSGAVESEPGQPPRDGRGWTSTRGVLPPDTSGSTTGRRVGAAADPGTVVFCAASLFDADRVPLAESRCTQVVLQDFLKER